MFEMFCKILAEGGIVEYLNTGTHRFDAALTMASFILEIIARIPGIVYIREVTRIVLLLRVGRILRLLLRFKHYRLLAVTYFNLLPIFVRLAGVIFMIYYIFALIGMDTFGGLIWLGNPDLNGTAFAGGRYEVLNFNDFSSAMLTLFALMVVNNWFVITEGFIAVTSEWARLYFVVFWFVAGDDT